MLDALFAMALLFTTVGEVRNSSEVMSGNVPAPEKIVRISMDLIETRIQIKLMCEGDTLCICNEEAMRGMRN
mgnify:CR=1 FL=1